MAERVTTQSLVELLPREYPRERQSRIAEEFKQAINATASSDLTAWGIRTGRILVGAGVRRIRVLQSIGEVTGGGIRNEWKAIRDARSFREYFASRRNSVSRELAAFGVTAAQTWRNLSAFSRENPATAASRLVLLCFGFNVGSGGLDGDGGLADLDWQLFGSHRSLLTHSVVPAIVIEVAVLSLVDLVATLHSHLPREHDSIWDSIKVGSKELELFAIGSSLGLAYHLGIDATIDGGGKYQGLPISLPQEGHQFIAGTFAAVEGLDAMARAAQRGDTLATFKTLSLASESIGKTEKPSSFVVKKLRNDVGFRVIWMPKIT